MKTVQNLFLMLAVCLVIFTSVGAVENPSPVQEAAAEVQAEVSQASDSVQEAVKEATTEAEPATPSDVPAGAVVYGIDAAHSTIGFSVKHLQISKVKGTFNDYTGKITYDPADLGKFNADVEINATSIDTNNEKRDGHLRNDDFFAVEQFQTITFKSTQLEKRGAGYVLVGDLTIRGVTKQITLPVEINGPVQSAKGLALGISATTSINRQDFNVSWNKALDNGGYILDDQVNLEIELELNEAK